MNEGKQWTIDENMLLDGAESRLQEGDYLGALTMLNKHSRMFKPSADAFALYADVYEAMELYPLAADAWFRFLDVCSEADFGEGYEGLAIAFMNMGNELQWAYYYHRALEEGTGDSEDMVFPLESEIEEKPHLRLVGEGMPDPETLSEGLELLKEGDLGSARSILYQVGEDCPDYPAARGLAAMCTLMMGDEKGAREECEKLLERFPENVQALTTYCAVLGAQEDKEGAKQVGRRLAALKTDRTEDLYRIATALCETGLDEEAFRVLTSLKERLPYDENVLFFHAVSSYKTGHLEDGIGSLELLTTLFPRKAIAAYYLEHMRMLRDKECEPFPMTYYYHLPEEEYNKLAGTFLRLSSLSERDEARLERYCEANRDELCKMFPLAFDEMEGQDEKLQMLAAKLAVRARADDFLRSVLLNYEGDDVVKLTVLRELTLRNEDNTFGTVFLNIYREFAFHAIDVGQKKYRQFMNAFADVYSKFALVDEANEGKLCAAAEDIYHAIEDYDAWEYCDERAALSAAIYREARLAGGERSLGEILKLFDANRYTTQEILDLMM